MGTAAHRLDAPSFQLPAGPLVRWIQRQLASVGPRCPSEHYAAFLRRSVRCRLDARHGDAHRFTTLDETVVWR